MGDGQHELAATSIPGESNSLVGVEKGKGKPHVPYQFRAVQGQEQPII